jgi:hypothetical protein
MPSRFEPAWLGKTPDRRRLTQQDFVPGTELPTRMPTIKDLISASSSGGGAEKPRTAASKAKAAAQRVDGGDHTSPTPIRYSPMGTPLSLIEPRDLGNVDALGLGIRSGQRSSAPSPNRLLYATRPGSHAPSSDQRRERLLALRKAALAEQKEITFLAFSKTLGMRQQQPWGRTARSPRKSPSPRRRQQSQREPSPSQMSSQRHGKRTQRKATTPKSLPRSHRPSREHEAGPNRASRKGSFRLHSGAEALHI